MTAEERKEWQEIEKVFFGWRTKLQSLRFLIDGLVNDTDGICEFFDKKLNGNGDLKMSMSWLEILLIVLKYLPEIIKIIQEITDEIEQNEMADKVTTTIGNMLTGGVKSEEDIKAAIATTLGVSPDRFA